MELFMSFNLADGTTFTCRTDSIIALQSHPDLPRCANLWVRGIDAPFVVDESHDDILLWIEQATDSSEE